jgi:hypothetical protein
VPHSVNVIGERQKFDGNSIPAVGTSFAAFYRILN